MRLEPDSPDIDLAATVERPAPPLGASGRAREWLGWFGVARLVTSAVAVCIVCAGAWWLVRTPTPPPESALPVAAPAVPGVTLPPPVASPSPSTSEPAASWAVVHVAGAVDRPGVVELRVDARVADALAAAGGASGAADLAAVNLAAVVVDGSQIYVPSIGEEARPALPTQPVASVAEPMGPIDVNVADAATLESLPGVGPATAAAIVTDRDRNGPFAAVEDLERVPGIGPAKVAALDGLVTT